MRNEFKQYFNSFYKNVGILNIASRVDMKCADMQVGFLYQFSDLIELVNRNTKFASFVPGRNLEIPPGHDIGSYSYTYRVAMPKFFPEFLQVG